MRFTTLSVSTAALMAFAGAALADVTITHNQGELTVTEVPAKVFTQDWASFDNLSALGVTVLGVPAGNVPGYLAEQVSGDAVQIGSLFEPDFETIAAEAPDLITVGGRSAATYPTMSGIVPTFDTSINNTDIIGGIKTRLTEFGEIFDLEDKAAELVANLDAKVAEAREAAADEGTGLVIVTNARNIGIYGPDSRVGWIYNELAIPSVFDDVDDGDHGGDGISFEYLVEKNPDWLFVVDRDAGTTDGTNGAAEALLDNELLAETTFMKNDQIIYLSPQPAYITMHGYQGVMLLLDEVIAGFQAND